MALTEATWPTHVPNGNLISQHIHLTNHLTSQPTNDISYSVRRKDCTYAQQCTDNWKLNTTRGHMMPPPLYLADICRKCFHG